MFHHPETMHRVGAAMHWERLSEAARAHGAAEARRRTPRWIEQLTSDQLVQYQMIRSTR